MGRGSAGQGQRIDLIANQWPALMPWRPVFFAVNFAGAIAFIMACVVAVGETFGGGGSPFAFLGGLCFVGPALAFAIAEWLLYVRNMRKLERPLGVACGGVAALAVFAFVSNTGEAIVYGGKSPSVIFWLDFGATCFSIAAYGFFCCWKRVRRGDGPGDRGFPVAICAERESRSDRSRSRGGT
jgi:hypothetical protein